VRLVAVTAPVTLTCQYCGPREVRTRAKLVQQLRFCAGHDRLVVVTFCVSAMSVATRCVTVTVPATGWGESIGQRKVGAPSTSVPFPGARSVTDGAVAATAVEAKPTSRVRSAVRVKTNTGGKPSIGKTSVRPSLGRGTT
jgi:hypothetical protein